MNEPIYFSKIEFCESIGYGKCSSIILLNLVQQELSYQVFRRKYQRASAIEGAKTEERVWDDEMYSYRFHAPAVFVANEHSDFLHKLGAFVLLVAPPIFAFMQLTDTARGYLSSMLMILALYMFGKSICVIVVSGIFNAGGDTKFDAYSVAVTMWGIIIPLAALSAFVWKLPVLAVHFIISMDEVIKLPWVYHHYKRYIWVKDITRDDL